MSETTNALDGSINHENLLTQCFERVITFETPVPNLNALRNLYCSFERVVSGFPEDFEFQSEDLEFHASGYLMRLYRDEYSLVSVPCSDIPDDVDLDDYLEEYAYDSCGDWHQRDSGVERHGLVYSIHLSPSGYSRLRDAIAASLTAEVA